MAHRKKKQFQTEKVKLTQNNRQKSPHIRVRRDLPNPSPVCILAIVEHRERIDYRAASSVG